MGCFTADRESFLAAGLDERPVGKDGEVMRADDELMQAWLELEKIWIFFLCSWCRCCREVEIAGFDW